jgi:hypothetical protein
MTKQFSNYSDLITFTRASGGHALRPVSYGSEILTNGTFDTDLSDWTTGSNVTSAYSSGEAQLTLGGSLTSTGANWFRTTDEVFEAGKLYRVTFDATYVSGTIGTYGLQAGHGYTEDIRVKSSGTYSFTVDSTIGVGQQSDRNKLTFGGESTGVWKIDNVSVKEVSFDESDGTLTLFEHPENVPRVEWDSAGNRLGLLVEESRTNLITDSEDISGVNQATADDDVAVAPDRTQTADKLIESTSNSVHWTYNSISATDNQDYTFSIYAKKSERTRLTIYPNDKAGVGFNAVYDIDAGTVVSTPAQMTTSIQDVGNGWYRCVGTWNANTGSNTVFVRIGLVSSGTTISYQGDGTSGLFLWGQQLEAGSFPTSYIKTTGSTATRSADVASIPVADFGYNQSAGSFLVEFSHTDPNGTTDTNYLLSVDSNARFLYNNSSNAGWYSYDGTTSLNYGNLASDGTFVKVASSMYKDGSNASIDGGTIKTSTASPQDNVARSDDLYIGVRYGGGGDELNGHIKSIKYYPRRLTNAQLQEITS